MQIVPLLQIEPEIGTVSAQLPEPQSDDPKMAMDAIATDMFG
jgi:hypothetical protein